MAEVEGVIVSGSRNTGYRNTRQEFSSNSSIENREQLEQFTKGIEAQRARMAPVAYRGEKNELFSTVYIYEKSSDGTVQEIPFDDWFNKIASGFAKPVTGEVLESNINHPTARLDIDERANLANDLIKQHNLQGAGNTTMVKPEHSYSDAKLIIADKSISNSVASTADIDRMLKICALLQEKIPAQDISVAVYTPPSLEDRLLLGSKAGEGRWKTQGVEQWLSEQSSLPQQNIVAQKLGNFFRGIKSIPIAQAVGATHYAAELNDSMKNYDSTIGNSLTLQARDEYKAIALGSKIEQGMSGGLSRDMGKADFDKFAEKYALDGKVAEKLDPTGLSSNPTYKLIHPKPIIPEVSLNDGDTMKIQPLDTPAVIGARRETGIA